MILAGDIGGTNTRLALFDDQLKMVGKPLKSPTGNGSALEAQIRQLFKRHKHVPDKACLAVAGPVIENAANATNIGRRFVARDIARDVGLTSLVLINDLVANASGIELLAKSETVTLLKGEHHDGTAAVVSPGTGLGQATLVWDGHTRRAIASEGGHTRYSPDNAGQRSLCEYLEKQFRSVTVERVISGRGIENIYAYFLHIGHTPAPDIARAIAKAKPGHRGAIISQAAIEKSCKLCVEVMTLFVSSLGIECANMAVKVFASGGVFVGGGIPPRILPLLKSPLFKRSFLNHPTPSIVEFLKRVPIKVILNDDTALEGAALYGSRFDA
jgi:glucokinase